MKRVRLISVTTQFSDGDWIESKDQASQGIRLIQTGNVGEGVYLNKENKSKFISEETFKKLRCTEIFPGDVLVSRLPDPIGRSCIIPDISQKMITAVDCTILRFDNTKCLPKYFVFFSKSNTYHFQIEQSTFGATRQRISRKNLEQITVPLPSIEEQRKIVEKLDTIQSAIDNKKQQLSLLEEAVKSEFVEMFGENPVESGKWKVETLGEVCSSIVRGPFGSALKKDFFVPKSDKTIKVYEQKHAIQKSSTIGSYYITQEKYEELKRFECKPGDFIMSCSGTMGEFYQLPEGCEKGIINQALCKFTLNEKLEPLFFYEWMKQSIHNLETRGSGIKNVAAVSFVKQMPMIVPSKDIQRGYTNFVQQIDKSKFVVKQQIADLQELLDSKMQEYFGE